MHMNLGDWLSGLPKSGNPLPILSFPSVQLLGVSVYELTHSSELQAKGMKAVADRVKSAVSLSMMDLSVEAEAFGCKIKASENEIPTVVGRLISDEEEAKALGVPEVGEGRTVLYIEAAKLACRLIKDRPVLAGIIGPFSLAGRLMDVSEALANCLVDPDFVIATLEKTTEFLIKYAKAYKSTGAIGILMAEPLAGLLSPELEREFSAPYVKRIIEAVSDSGFCVFYHNCGQNTPYMTESLSTNGAVAYHFGNAINLDDILKKMPPDKLVLGNVSPTGQFLNGTPESIYKATTELLERCSKYPNFVLSSGCDIPPRSPWENIEAFFSAACDSYNK
jgi:uroporphyrinogen decarboxylase